ncbi:MAG: haloacid dehalogenase [Candidatus Omnitrophota bacterium]|jgi:YrbI family 3-deoxy-D-manno-octulosonate 8-phosphate phosphatase|nr:MAG: haloacid dehalogenase [Candidatus Omnitrophota bacterium]
MSLIPLTSIQLIVFDFDGVLTDNRVLVLENGMEGVFCNRSDGLAFDLLRKVPIPTMILSTETNPVVKVRAEKLKLPVLHGIDNKGIVLQDYCQKEQIDLNHVIFVGNDINDLPAMQIVGYPVAVADAHPAVLKNARYILSAKGGEGAARALVSELLDIEFFLQKAD